MEFYIEIGEYIEAKTKEEAVSIFNEQLKKGLIEAGTDNAIDSK